MTASQVQVGQAAGRSSYFIGRQPIINVSEQTYAYELLFRSGQLSYAEITDGSAATEHVFNCVMNVMGLSSLVGSSKAFINVTEKVLLESSYSILPSDRVVIELLEDIEPTPEVINACQKLKRRGYALALDDFVGRDDYKELLEIADVVKVDFMGTPRGRLSELTTALKQYNAQLLAEKVESIEDVKLAKELGYKFF